MDICNVHETQNGLLQVDDCDVSLLSRAIVLWRAVCSRRAPGAAKRASVPADDVFRGSLNGNWAAAGD